MVQPYVPSVDRAGTLADKTALVVVTPNGAEHWTFGRLEADGYPRLRASLVGAERHLRGVEAGD